MSWVRWFDTYDLNDNRLTEDAKAFDRKGTDGSWGGANAAGLGVGRALQSPAKKLSTTNIPGRQGIPFTSPTGRQFNLFGRPPRQITDEISQQLIQDLGGAATSTAINELR